MTKVQELEREIEQLSPEELAAFRQWFARFDAMTWDRQIEADVEAGKLDALAQEALRAHKSGNSTQL
jgi:hypothetical protein